MRGDRGGELALHRRLDAAVDRQRDRLAAQAGIDQPLLEHPLHAGDAMAVEVGPAEDVAGQRGLRIEPLGLAVEDDARLAERVDRRDQLGHGAAGEIDEVAVGVEHRAIFGGAALGHQLVRAGRRARAGRR